MAVYECRVAKCSPSQQKLHQWVQLPCNVLKGKFGAFFLINIIQCQNQHWPIVKATLGLAKVLILPSSKTLLYGTQLLSCKSDFFLTKITFLKKIDLLCGTT